MYALQVLKALWLAQKEGGTVTVPSLHGALQMRFERIEAILESMRAAGWVNRAPPLGWVLVRNPGTIAVADVYKLFVFDPIQQVNAPDGQPEWLALARTFGERIGDGAQMSVANLFEAGSVDIAGPKVSTT